MAKRNLAGWVEIPVTNMKRAKKFYETVFKVKLKKVHVGETDLAMFPFAEKGMGAGVALAYNKKYYKPSKGGLTVYFTTPTGDLDKDLKNAEKAGGKTTLKTTDIGKHGWVAAFTDTEGNRIHVHMRK